MSNERKNKDAAMARQLVLRGYPHGRRFSAGLDAVPANEPGSAAYRRLVRRRRRA